MRSTAVSGYLETQVTGQLISFRADQRSTLRTIALCSAWRASK